MGQLGGPCNDPADTKSFIWNIITFSVITLNNTVLQIIRLTNTSIIPLHYICLLIIQYCVIQSIYWYDDTVLLWEYLAI